MSPQRVEDPLVTSLSGACNYPLIEPLYFLNSRKNERPLRSPPLQSRRLFILIDSERATA